MLVLRNHQTKAELLKFLDLVEVNEESEEPLSISTTSPLSAATESMLLKVRAQMLDVNEQYVRDLDRWKLNTGGLGTDASKVQLKPAVNLLRPLLIRSKKIKRRAGAVAPASLPPPLPLLQTILQNHQAPAPQASKPVFLPPSRPLFAATSGGFSGGSIPAQHQLNHSQQSPSAVVKKRKADDSSSSVVSKTTPVTVVKETVVNPVVVPPSSSSSSSLPVSVAIKRDDATANEIGSGAKKRRHRVNENGESVVGGGGVGTPATVVKSEVERGDVVMRRIVDDSENRNEISRLNVRLTSERDLLSRFFFRRDILNCD